MQAIEILSALLKLGTDIERANGHDSAKGQLIVEGAKSLQRPMVLVKKGSGDFITNIALECDDPLNEAGPIIVTITTE